MEKSRQAIAVFDFDGTMIKGDTIVRYVLYAVERGLLSPLTLVYQLWNARRTLTKKITDAQGKSNALRFLGKMDAQQQEEFDRSFCQHKLLPRIYPKAIQRMKEHRAKGDYVLMLSASPDSYMKYWPAFLPADHVLATPTGPDGKVENTLRWHEKVKGLQQWAQDMPFEVDWENSWAYGDSAHDLPVMRLTGHPVRVNPKPAMLKEGEGLPVEDWRA